MLTFITDVVALTAPYHQGRPFIHHLIWVFERKVRHVRQRLGERLQRDAKPHLRLRRRGPRVVRPIHRNRALDEVGQQKLADRDVFLVFLQDLVRVGLLRDGRIVLLDLEHGVDVGLEVGLEGRVDGRVVYGDEARVGGRVAQGECHGDFSAHGVAHEDGGSELVRGDEGLDVGGHGGVGVRRRVG